ncbi:MAG: GAF domain-containing protein [Chloroflexi bacterium]|nr:GAF domain-containing protein [Chloroflexota bacterium]
MINQSITGSLRPQELDAVYTISKVVAEAVEIDIALDEIVKLARQVFIFDNTVLYLQNGKATNLEPTFAKAIGRGRSSEADLAWGGKAALEAFKTGENFLQEADIIQEEDRLDQHFFLGLPMIVGGETIGALIFIRFGGPNYSADQINLAEFIAAHVSQLLQHQRFVERIARLEADRRLAKLQEDFIATVSHELNTPLGFIKGYTTTLLREDTKWDDQTRQDFLTIIDEEADRLGELIDNLLDSSRLQSGAMGMYFQEFDLIGMIHESSNRQATRYSDLDIQVQTDANELIIQADPNRLSQVIDNLVNNTAKYAPNCRLEISVAYSKEQVEISLGDNGPGIPSQHLEHLFKRFYRVPERSAGVRGSGLGLFICERIIKAHKGKITVESEINQGTTFKILLPITQGSENNSEAKEV